jgi:methylglutamate dehydrogenase subunit B
MRINCPHCGPRDLAEYYYWGDASREAPQLGASSTAAVLEHVYGRRNPRGSHKEHWQHLGGCRAFLCVERNTATHEIFSVEFARNAKTGAQK